MSTPTSKFTTPPSVAAQIARLPGLPMPEIKALWQRLFGDDTPTHNRQFLERRIASLVETGKVKKRDRDYRPAAGTALTREYQGALHRVIVTQDGQYDFQGRMYPSLSMIAREITGTRWSGPLFFGLKAPAAPKTTAKKGARR